MLATIFLIMKPKYSLESRIYDGEGPGTPQKLLNGYPTDRMTIRRETVRASTVAGDGLARQKYL